MANEKGCKECSWFIGELQRVEKNNEEKSGKIKVRYHSMGPGMKKIVRDVSFYIQLG